jgi:ElaB/YqjD/DUF883 family membrane-anchored ribosome-binding protein
MSGQIEGTAASAVGAHSKDAMQPPTGERPTAKDSSGTPAGSGDGARKISDDAMATVSDAAASAADMARSAGASISQAGGRVRRQGAQTGEYVGDLVKADPLLALLGAGALGFALGLLVGRR